MARNRPIAGQRARAHLPVRRRFAGHHDPSPGAPTAAARRPPSGQAGTTVLEPPEAEPRDADGSSPRESGPQRSGTRLLAGLLALTLSRAGCVRPRRLPRRE